MKTVLPDRQQSLVQWISQATGINTFGVKIRLRGNDLHILCEGTECPQRWRTLSDLLQALQQTDLDSLTSNEQPSIYQVFVYGRRKGEQRPKWCHKVYLNQIDKHIEQVEQALLADSGKSKPVGGALIVSNESLARQGNPDAIARYLSETLSTLGVSVQAKIKLHKSKNSQVEENRLWIFCHSSYSPDASLLAEPIAQKLRYLKLSGYEDAVIVSQVTGETAPDWLLRVDLTPPEVMLKEWARWGDVQAIARLLTEVLSGLNVAVQASLKESTLHIFCTPAFDPLGNAPIPDKTVCLEAIVPQLEAIAPQGILGVTIYGEKAGDHQPGWIDWLALPASEHSVFATTPLDLANTGDEEAIVFLLERLLNPDLDWRLLTGGIRVLLLNKGDLLHIMCDAPVCPSRGQVANKVTQFIRQLRISGIKGVRVYGRRAGNKEPFWHHGIDLEHRQRLVPEATPEFAATSKYVNDLVTSDTSEPILRPDLTTEEVQSFVTEAALDWLGTVNATVKKFLLATQLFTETDQLQELNHDDGQGIKIALVWGTLGLLLTLQSDWVLGQIIARTTPSSPTVANVSPSSSPEPKVSLTSGKNPSEQTKFFASAGKAKTSDSDSSVFNASQFTQTDDAQNGSLAAAPLKEKATATAILLAARSQIPSFNVRQLDEQLALYKQRLARTGTPPDVLIIGSSRALRGVDPAALSKALATQGYPNIDVFNFGINGATAQVVDFVLRHVLEPSELPKLIIWADGARAFNSGREDMTFKSIAASAGYKQAFQKSPQAATNSDLSENPKQEKTKQENPKEEKQEVSGYQAVNDWLNQTLASVSVSYQNRDKIKSLVQKQLLIFGNEPTTTSQKQLTDSNSEDTYQQAVDFDGFLALSIRFNPARYYQKHSRVPGNYDNDYKTFQVGGEQDAAFQEVLEFTQSQKIPLVFVNMPLTADYLDPVRKKYEQEFQQYMLRLAANPNFIYRDLSQQWPKVNDYFSDPSHLNRFGAYEVSKKLAYDPMIPWPVK
ncbi:MAG: DUF1574 domain-containing protein [Nostoc sp. ChiSLP02]|nr:DUF1574 domain-containing protein [Nostoc sp. DedSLP05]MDZ8101484.1 DUF1574 domain-containing protein [Nostoc sp. DedSLP01]MDZ8184741.1 DUF1574 domain-containing protein [Nostoc sp. ChiSLP02]